MQQSIERQVASADYWRRDWRKIRKCRARFHGRIAGSQARKDGAHPAGRHFDHSGASAWSSLRRIDRRSNG
jgi:putative sigma-54 modulation protein